ncbi:hypothetical protein [Heyndrickxia oleronia]|jgi:hypothetical protein|uniref:hypothetical protein n=1 Tax=Heyndrickxia oleronia TaxID=38875 RepID=UPI00311A75F1
MMMRMGLFLILLFSLVGCSSEVSKHKDAQPPSASIHIGEKNYKTKLGTYCWSSNNKGVCVDTAGPVELLKDQKPIHTKPGETIQFVMDYKPQPNQFHVVQINEDEELEIPVKNNQFTAPTQKGIYYYSYGVWWMDKKDKNLSHGDAFYAFAIEVK